MAPVTAANSVTQKGKHHRDDWSYLGYVDVRFLVLLVPFDVLLLDEHLDTFL